ncbi:MAG: cAMP-binding protein [Subtercola sp.]|nr:cAMP-binding protein [Subtercola sp.]
MALFDNHILTNLLPNDRSLLELHLEAIDLPFRFPIELAQRPVTHVYFPNSGLASVVACGVRDQIIEVGIIGRDGLTGCAVLLGSDRSPNTIHMQVAGSGFRIEADHIREAMRKSETLRTSLLKFVQAFLQQASQTALANGRATLETRLARWMVMAHDRVENTRLPLTHDFLAIMLGVRRPGVTVALQKLQASGLVETHRNVIQIKNREGLEAIAGGFYGVTEAEQERLTGWRSIYRR